MGKVVRLATSQQNTRRLLKIAIGKTVQGDYGNRVANSKTTWEEFTPRFANVIRTTETIADYFRMSTTAQGDVKDVGYFVPANFKGGIRKKVNIDGGRSMLVLDVDHAAPSWKDDIAFVYGHLEYHIHTTHKHTPQKPRLRLAFAITRDVNEEEYGALARQIAAQWDIDVFDDTTYEFSRVMHFPSASIDGVFEHVRNEGAWIDPDVELAKYANWKDIQSWPRSSREKEKWLSIGNQKVADPREKTGIVGAFCRAHDIESAMTNFIPDAYTRGDGERFTYNQGSAANGAVLYDGGQALFSHHESDPCHGRSVNSWDLVRLHLFADKDKNLPPKTAPGDMPSFRAMCSLARKDKATQEELLLERENTMVDEFDSFGEVPTESLNVPRETKLAEPAHVPRGTSARKTAAKKKKVKWDLRYGENGSIVASLHNLVEMLEKDEHLTGLVRLNDFTGEILQFGRLPASRAKAVPEGAEWSDLAELQIKHYLEWKYKLAYPTQLIHEGITLVATRHRMHPPLDWLESLAWDGVSRLETFLIDYLGAADNKYTRAVFKKWCCGAVARLKSPGIKFDTMIVFEGVEGTMKSTFFRELAKGWFTDDMSFGYESKEVVEKTRAAWIVEIPEMVARNQAEVEHNRAFISRQVEKVRMSYARNAGTFPRHWVLAGTTNENGYLRSITGNRRYWPVKGDGRKIDLAAIRPIIDQLWAEAYELWQFGEDLYLDQETFLLAQREQDERIAVDDWAATIEQWLLNPLPANYWEGFPGEHPDMDATDAPLVPRDRVCALEVWVECLHGDTSRFSHRDAARVNRILAKVPNWESVSLLRFGKRYGRGRGFKTIL